MIAQIWISKVRQVSTQSPHLLVADVRVECDPHKIDGQLYYRRSSRDPQIPVPDSSNGTWYSTSLRAWMSTLTGESWDVVMTALRDGCGMHEVDICEATEASRW